MDYRGPLHIALAGAIALAVGVVAAVLYKVTQSTSGRPVVYAASSLKVLTKISNLGATTFQFASSQALERQILAGGPADVFVSASPQYASALFGVGRCTKPVVFATDAVVIVTPESNPARVHSLKDLASMRGVVIAVAASGVPAGDAARQLLKNLRMSDILSRNIVTSAADDAAAALQVRRGDAQAGVVFATDWHATPTSLREIVPPASAQPPVRYEVCAVRRSGARSDAAAAFISRLTGPQGRSALSSAGFGLPITG